MEEGTNKAIVINSIILYAKLIVTIITGIVTTRYALQALGVEDFGIFSVVGGVISFIVIVNTVMLSTTNRFIAVAIGKKDEREVNIIFNVCLLVHILIAILTLLIAFPIGDFYIYNYINYEGDLDLVAKVYKITIVGSVLSFIGVPYNGLLLAKEKFVVFCSTEMLLNIIKLIFCYLLLFYFEDKLMAYTLINVLVVVVPVFVYFWYCKKKYPEYVKTILVRDRKRYKEVMHFSIWVGYGALSYVGRNQGAALIINKFFTAALNASFGIVNSLSAMLGTFSGNVCRSISPQIVKSYSGGDLDRSRNLVCLSSKATFFLTLLVSMPFFVCPQFIFQLWLGNVPEMIIVFTQLMIIDNLVKSLNAGIPDLIFATGRIKKYQLVENTILIVSVIVAYFVLKNGAPADYLLITYIIFSIIVFFVRQTIISEVVDFNVGFIIKRAYAPSLVVGILFSPLLFVPLFSHPMIVLSVYYLYLFILIWFFGFTGNERNQISDMLLSKIRKS